MYIGKGMVHNGSGQETMRQRTFFMKIFFKKRFKGSFQNLWALLGCWTLLVLSTGLISLAPIPVWAIIQHPSQSQILEAIQKGQEGAKKKIPPNALYWRFGASVDEAKPYGFLMTKLSGIAVMASHFALRGEKPDSQDIGRVLGEEVLQVVVTIFGDSPTFAMDSYLILKQGNRLIAPERLRFDARASSTNQRDGRPVFRAKVVASFVYGTFDSDAPTTIKVFPGAGGESTFDVDFSAIP
jgi:hypothetical protein